MGSYKRAAELFRIANQAAPESREQLLEGIKDHDPLVRHVAAIELAKLWPRELPEATIRELLETLAYNEYFESSPLERDYAEASETDEGCGSLGQDIVVAFSHLNCGQADFVIHRLLEFWSFDNQFYELGHAMLALAFPLSNRLLSKDSLSGLQRRILKALIAQPTIWNGDMSWQQTLSQYGLPQALNDTFSMLGYHQ